MKHEPSSSPRLRTGDHVPCETNTPLSVAAIAIAAGAAHQAVLVAKLTLSIDGGGIATIVPTPRALGGDVYCGEPFVSPLRSASDFAPVKPRVDVTLVGVAVGSDADARREIRFAFGGPRGFVRARRAADASALGPIAPIAEERRRRLGTFDSEWAAKGWPAEPRDHDPLFHQASPVEQQLPRLRGDEPFEISGWRGAETLRGTLPGMRVDAAVERTDGRREDVALKLDTVAFDLERLEVDLVFRGHASCADRRGRDLERVVFRTAGRGAPPCEDPAPSVSRRAHSTELPGPSRAEVEALVAAGASLTGARFAGARLAGIDLSGVDLSGADLTGADLSGARLSGALLDRADLSRVRATGADLSSARAANARFCEADLTDARLEKCVLAAADLTRARLDRASLRCADFTDAKLYEVSARGADLGEARARGARAEAANLDGASLERASLAGADLERASLREANLRGAVLDDAGARGAAFDGADLSRASAQRARLSEASFEGARLVSANLMQAELDLARLTGADLRGSNLYRADLRGADVERARLEKAALVGTVLARTA